VNDRLARLRKVRGKYKDVPPYLSTDDHMSQELIRRLTFVCVEALKRIESDIEAKNSKTAEGDMLRAVIDEAKPFLGHGEEALTDSRIPHDDLACFVGMLDLAVYHLQPTRPQIAVVLAGLRDILNRPGTIVVQGEST
jgi:hypothetical protein